MSILTKLFTVVGFVTVGILFGIGIMSVSEAIMERREQKLAKRLKGKRLLPK